MDTISPLLTDCDAAEILGITTRSLARLTRESRIPYVRLPDGQIRYSGPALADWIRQHEVTPSTEGTANAS